LGLDNEGDEAARRRSMRNAGNDRRFPFRGRDREESTGNAHVR
jgi:hypothetical protein